MPDVKRGALLPTGEENGLADVASQLVAQGTGRAPHRLYAVIGIVDARRVAVDADSGAEVATVRFRRVEVLLPADLAAAEKLLRRALESRSGQTTLPLDLEDQIREAFSEMLDPESPDDPADADDQGDEPDDGKDGKK